MTKALIHSASTRDIDRVSGRLVAARQQQPQACRVPVHEVSPVTGGEHPALVQIYQRMGGLVSCDHAAALLGRHHEQPISRLARWIVAREVVTFSWQSATLIPLFQFDASDMTLRGAASAVIAELSGALDDFELAAWFARPNCWLGGAAPVAMIETDQLAVIRAARADRYIALG